jgi:hypothetical protein
MNPAASSRGRRLRSEVRMMPSRKPFASQIVEIGVSARVKTFEPHASSATTARVTAHSKPALRVSFETMWWSSLILRRGSRSAPLPPALRARLEEILGPEVGEVRIVEHSFFNRLHGCPRAVTRRGRIYLHGSAAEFFADPELVLHEYFHVLRQWANGRMTLTRYLIACLRAGYWNNPFEIEARRFASRHKRRLAADR